MFDVEKLLLNSIANNIESLANLGIDFIPKEMMKDDKTSGSIATSFIRLAHAMP